MTEVRIMRLAHGKDLAVAVLSKRACRRFGPVGRGAGGCPAHHGARRARAGTYRDRTRIAARHRGTSSATLGSRDAPWPHGAQFAGHHRRGLSRRNTDRACKSRRRISEHYARDAHRAVGNCSRSANFIMRGRDARRNAARQRRLRLHRQLKISFMFAPRRLADCSLLPLKFVASGPNHAAGISQGHPCHCRCRRCRNPCPSRACFGESPGVAS